MDDCILDEQRLLRKVTLFAQYKYIAVKFLQGMTCNVMFTFCVGETIHAVYD